MHTPRPSSPDHTMIGRIMPPNLEEIHRSLPHRLYADIFWGWIEIRTKKMYPTNTLSANRGGVIFVIQTSWFWGGMVHSFLIDDTGSVFTIDPLGGLHHTEIHPDILAMLLNPVAEIGDLRLQDIDEVKRHQSHAFRDIGMYKSVPGVTFHPELESIIEGTRQAVLRRMSR